MINTLIRLSKILNENQIKWELGSSCLLLLYGAKLIPNDIDIIVAKSDIEKCTNILDEYFIRLNNIENIDYSSDYFLRYNLGDYNLEIISGFRIMKNNLPVSFYDITNKNNIRYIVMESTKIYLGDLEDWYKFYELMDRPEKLKIIENLKK